MYIAYLNESNVVEYYQMDLVNNEGTEAEIIAMYQARHPGSVATDTLPDIEKQEYWTIADGQVVIDESSAIEAKKIELCTAIDEDVELNKFKTISVNGNVFDVDRDTMANLGLATAPVDWVLNNNTVVTLSTQQLNDLISAVSQRTTSLVLEGRGKKDLVRAMTALSELNAVDITTLNSDE